MTTLRHTHPPFATLPPGGNNATAHPNHTPSSSPPTLLLWRSRSSNPGQRSGLRQMTGPPPSLPPPSHPFSNTRVLHLSFNHTPCQFTPRSDVLRCCCALFFFNPSECRRHYSPPLPGEPGSISGGVALVFSHVGIVPDDATCRRVFSGISRFPRPIISALLHTHLASPSSALKDPDDGAALECRVGGSGSSPRKPAGERHRQARFPLAKVRERARRGSSPDRLAGRRLNGGSFTTRWQPSLLTFLDSAALPRRWAPAEEGTASEHSNSLCSSSSPLLKMLSRTEDTVSCLRQTSLEYVQWMMFFIKELTFLHHGSPFLAEKCGSYKGYTETCYKSAIASTSRALSWRAVNFDTNWETLYAQLFEAKTQGCGSGGTRTRLINSRRYYVNETALRVQSRRRAEHIREAKSGATDFAHKHRTGFNSRWGRSPIGACGNRAAAAISEIVHGYSPATRKTSSQHLDERWRTLTDLVQPMLFPVCLIAGTEPWTSSETTLKDVKQPVHVPVQMTSLGAITLKPHTHFHSQFPSTTSQIHAVALIYYSGGQAGAREFYSPALAPSRAEKGRAVINASGDVTREKNDRRLPTRR
ncbi:hypothetical protein PR048_025450 [Dryococelus australis]|uniref:Uncharacterized protein n=1 Tax=Dryococelus australis TaxID=614101 RepID=A0ABQ9GRF8_9NEOP|nr:hypothetical protein PR048_025450 [Dryococelus australis]